MVVDAHLYGALGGATLGAIMLVVANHQRGRIQKVTPGSTDSYKDSV